MYLEPEVRNQLPAELLQRYNDAAKVLNAIDREVTQHMLSTLTEMPVCPECGSVVDRPKCFYELGGGCPRHDVVARYGGIDAIKRHFAKLAETRPQE